MLLEIEEKTGISDDVLCQSLDVLHPKGLVEVEKIDNGSITGCTPRIAGFDLFLRVTDSHYPIAKLAMSMAVEYLISGRMPGKSSTPSQTPTIWRHRAETPPRR